MNLFSSRKRKLSTLLHVERPRRSRPTMKKRTKASLKNFSSSFNKSVSKFTTPRFFLACVSITLFGVAVGIVFFSSFFKLNTILVSRDSAYVNPQAIETFLQTQKGKNIFLLDSGELKTQLMEEFPMLSSIEISRLLPQTIRVKVTSYPIFSRIKNESVQKEYFLNTNGVLVQPDQNQVQKDMLLFTLPSYSELGEEFKDVISPYVDLHEGRKIFTKEYMLFFQKVVDAYGKNFDTKLTSIAYYPIEKELHVILTSGTQLYFSLSKDLDTQIFLLKTFLIDAKSNVLATGEYQYVDLRVKDKVIMCKKTSACAK